MPQRCSICAHPQQTDIERAMVGREPFRQIAQRYGTSGATLIRHRDNCMAPPLESQQVVVDAVRERTVRGELEHLFSRVHKLFDACDAWLRDPNDQGRYELGPRAEEVKVVYVEWTDAGDRQIPVRKSDTLARLLEKIEGTGLEVERLESKHADPRQLVLNTAAQLTKQIELLAKLTGELNETPEINVLVSPQWLELRTLLLATLQQHPAALEAVHRAFAALPQAE